MTDKKNEEKKTVMQELAPYMGLGIQLAATVTAMVFLGLWLDKKFAAAPLWLIVCSSFGVIAALYNFIRTALKQDK